jgi:hypothetical protein
MTTTVTENEGYPSKTLRKEDISLVLTDEEICSQNFWVSHRQCSFIHRRGCPLIQRTLLLSLSLLSWIMCLFFPRRFLWLLWIPELSNRKLAMVDRMKQHDYLQKCVSEKRSICSADWKEMVWETRTQAMKRQTRVSITRERERSKKVLWKNVLDTSLVYLTLCWGLMLQLWLKK